MLELGHKAGLEAADSADFGEKPEIDGRPSRARGAALVVLAAAIWATAGPIRRQIDLPAEVSAAGRSGFGALAIAAWWFMHRVRSRANAGGGYPSEAIDRSGSGPGATRLATSPFSVRPGLMVGAGLAVALTWWCQYAAVDHLPVGAVYLIMYLSPVLVVLGAGFLGERVDRRLLFGLGLGVAGVSCVAYSMWAGGAVWPEGGNRLVGVLLAVGAAVGLAGLNLGTKLALRYYRADVVPLQEFLVASAVLVPLAVYRAGRLPTAGEWALLVVLGVVHSGLAVMVFSFGLTMVPVSTASVLAYAEPVGAVLVAWAFLGEVPQIWTLVGGGLIVCGGVLALRDAVATSG